MLVEEAFEELDRQLDVTERGERRLVQLAREAHVPLAQLMAHLHAEVLRQQREAADKRQRLHRVHPPLAQLEVFQALGDIAIRRRRKLLRERAVRQLDVVAPEPSEGLKALEPALCALALACDAAGEAEANGSDARIAPEAHPERRRSVAVLYLDPTPRLDQRARLKDRFHGARDGVLHRRERRHQMHNRQRELDVHLEEWLALARGRQDAPLERAEGLERGEQDRLVDQLAVVAVHSVLVREGVRFLLLRRRGLPLHSMAIEHEEEIAHCLLNVARMRVHHCGALSYALLLRCHEVVRLHQAELAPCDQLLHFVELIHVLRLRQRCDVGEHDEKLRAHDVNRMLDPIAHDGMDFLGEPFEAVERGLRVVKVGGDISCGRRPRQHAQTRRKDAIELDERGAEERRRGGG